MRGAAVVGLVTELARELRSASCLSKAMFSAPWKSSVSAKESSENDPAPRPGSWSALEPSRLTIACVKLVTVSLITALRRAVAQRVLGHHRLRRDRDDRSLAPAASGAGRERHRDANQVEPIAGPVGQVVARIDAAQLVQVIQIIGVLVEHDRGLKGNRGLLGRARCSRRGCIERGRRSGTSHSGRRRARDRRAGSRAALRQRLNDICPDLHLALLRIRCGAREALISLLNPDLEPAGHLCFVFGAEFGQPVLAPDVGRLDADRSVGGHDAIEVIDHVFGVGEAYRLRWTSAEDVSAVPSSTVTQATPVTRTEASRSRGRSNSVGAAAERPWNPRVRSGEPNGTRGSRRTARMPIQGTSRHVRRAGRRRTPLSRVRTGSCARRHERPRPSGLRGIIRDSAMLSTSSAVNRGILAEECAAEPDCPKSRGGGFCYRWNSGADR